MKSDNSRSSNSTMVTEDNYEAQWRRMLNLYEEFKREFNREPLERELFKGNQIGRWAATQRVAFHSGKLVSHRQEQLTNAGFVFSIFDVQWQRMLGLYVEFKENFERDPQPGDVYGGIDLWTWSNRQKHSYNSGKLSPERVKQLEDAGFVFSVYEAQWERILELYVEFKENFGREPQPEDVYEGVDLWSWSNRQKYLYNSGKLAPQRHEQLTNAGFVFSVYDVQWQRTFELYVEFKKIFGREPKNREIYKDEKLGYWAAKQRMLNKAGKLLPERKMKLENVDAFFNEGEKVDSVDALISCATTLSEQTNNRIHNLCKHKEEYKIDN